MSNSQGEHLLESTYSLQGDDNLTRTPSETWISRLQIWRKPKEELLMQQTEPSISASTSSSCLSDYQSSATLSKNSMSTLQENLRLAQHEIEPLNSKEKEEQFAIQVADVIKETMKPSSDSLTLGKDENHQLLIQQKHPSDSVFVDQSCAPLFINRMSTFEDNLRWSQPEIEPLNFEEREKKVAIQVATVTEKTESSWDSFNTLEKLKITSRQLITALAVSWVSLLIGYTSAYTSPADKSLRRDFNLTEDEVSWVGSLMPLSAVLGGLIGGKFIDWIGRKWTLLLTDILFFMAWSVNYFAKNYYYLYLSRSLIGCGVGIASLIFPVYLGETIQPEVRGTLGLLPTTLGNMGILICFLLGNILEWQGLAGVALIITVPFFLIFIWIIPETPRWYVSKNKLEECKKSLQWLRGKKQDITKEFNELVLNQKEQTLRKSAKITDIFSRDNIKPLLICLTLMCFQQFTGINAVIFYTTKIFQGSGSSLPPLICTTIIGVVNLLSTFIANALIDKLGRKVLLYFSSCSMAVCLGILGLYYYLKDVMHIDVTEYGYVPLACLIVFALGFSLGFGPIPWLMMGEILPARIKGPAASVATAFNWTTTFIVTKTFPIMIDSIGSCWTFWFYGFMVVLSVVFTAIFVPETQGQSLEEIERRITNQSVKKYEFIS